MATAFENFALTELVAKPEDALRLASLAAVDGQKIRGYAGNYFQYTLGDATVVVRTLQDYETGESELYGMDTHAASDCVWECSIQEDITPPHFDPLERRLLVAGKGKGLAVVDLVNADVLPAFYHGTQLRLNMVGFPRWIDYLPDEAAYTAAQREKPDGQNAVLAEGGIFSCGYVITHDPHIPNDENLEENFVQIRGIVKDVKVGETYMGMEPMTTFIRTTVTTNFGDIELCHTAEQVAEAQKDQVKVGSIVSALCVLSGDPAIGGYAGGVFCSEEQDLLLLRNFFEHGGADRLRPAMHSDCVYTSDYSGASLEGMDATIALLKDVEAALDDESRYYAYPAHLTGVETADGETPPPYIAGKKCLLLAQGGPEKYVALCFVETDSVGRIKQLRLSQDGRYTFERDDVQPDPFAGVEPPKDALEAMLPWAVMEGLIQEAEEVMADTSSFQTFEDTARRHLEGLLTVDADMEEALPLLFGELYAAVAGSGREKGESLYQGFHRYLVMAQPTPGKYRQQLLNALVLVQRFAELNRG